MTRHPEYETGTTLSTLTRLRKEIKKIKKNMINENKEISLAIRSKLRYDYKTGLCINAFQVIQSPEILRIAYEIIKSNPGNMVRGSDRVTLDGITELYFKKTSEAISRETYYSLPSRRVYIPKANGKMRPLGISSPLDKIVQQAMRIVMEEVLEPKFHRSSHGFRPHRGCHSALKKIRGWNGVT
jgi:retron-type reverse transcriptase